ncbi:MAG: HD domain-containing protein [bacterium]|nr:HD domain-containing protein [bacterium]
MSNQLKDFHHYKGDGLNPFEKVERRVIELIYLSKIPDEKREESRFFEFMHAAGCMQAGRILAQKRNLNVDIASTASVLHDVYVIVNGTYKDHAKLGAQMAKKILKEINGFSSKEIDTITKAISHHSEKELHSNDPYVELVKDVDAFECSLYKNAEGFYRLHKPQHIFNEYVKRIKKVRKELGLKSGKVFR